MSRLRPNWLLGLVTNLNGVSSDDLQSAKLLVARNGQILSEGPTSDYTYDGTNVNFLIDIEPRDVILLIDPSIGAVRRLHGGTNVVLEEPQEPEPEPEPVVTPDPEPDPEPEEEPLTEDEDVTSSDDGRDDEESPVLEDEDSQLGA